jgi:hypothetical protein
MIRRQRSKGKNVTVIEISMNSVEAKEKEPEGMYVLFFF